ncbi:hypothetical protein CCR97_19645 [Rhodoplanes elegans]|nr:hypothetical protein [Rhodoplanes elegans]
MVALLTFELCPKDVKATNSGSATGQGTEFVAVDGIELFGAGRSSDRGRQSLAVFRMALGASEDASQLRDVMVRLRPFDRGLVQSGCRSLLPNSRRGHDSPADAAEVEFGFRDFTCGGKNRRPLVTFDDFTGQGLDMLASAGERSYRNR